MLCTADKFFACCVILTNFTMYKCCALTMRKAVLLSCALHVAHVPVTSSTPHAVPRSDMQLYPGAGSKARDDHVSYGAVEYRDSLQFIYNKVCFEDKDLQTDSRRVELNITYQSDQPTPLSTPSSSTS